MSTKAEKKGKGNVSTAKYEPATAWMNEPQNTTLSNESSTKGYTCEYTYVKCPE